MIEANSCLWTVALDGGTTNTRARLLKGNQIVATTRRAVGVRDTVLSGGGVSPLMEAVRGAIAQVLDEGHCSRPNRIVAAGMLGAADVGLVSVPHVVTPAGLDELARGSVRHAIPSLSAVPILFIPGVRTPPGEGSDGWIEADVMRGEECETLGAWLALDLKERVGFVWPGSHAKYVEVDSRGRITSSTTTLAGELTMAVARHTLLAGSLPEQWSDNLDTEAVALAERLVVARGVPLMRLAFLVRVANLTQSLTAAQRVAFWIAAVAATDAMHLGHLATSAEIPLLIGGRDSLRSIYGKVISECSCCKVKTLDDDVNERASALGALAIAERWEQIHHSTAETAP